VRGVQGFGTVVLVAASLGGAAGGAAGFRGAEGAGDTSLGAAGIESAGFAVSGADALLGSVSVPLAAASLAFFSNISRLTSVRERGAIVGLELFGGTL